MLDVKQVSKLYSESAGIRDISFVLEAGDIAAVIGPNGSGKTTLLNILAGILRSDSGEVYLDDLKASEIRARREIGYLPDTIIVNPRMKVIDLLYMVSDYKFNGEYKKEIEHALELYRMKDYRNARIGDLSMGNKKKVGIIIAFMGSPKLIILDEPSNGIDTHGMIQLKDSILNASQNGSIIILSCHVLDFVKSISKKNFFLKDTKLAATVHSNENLENVYKNLFF